MTGAPIDWPALRDRLSATASEQADEEPRRVAQILRQRARTAAQVPVKASDVPTLSVLTFGLAGETYALETKHVRQVFRLHRLTPLPGTPPHVAGVTNLRGNVLAVLDLRSFFDIPTRGLAEFDRVVVLGDPAHGGFGLLTDSIDGVRALPVGELAANLPTLGGVRARYLIGVTASAVVVLDGAKLLADPGLKVDAVRGRTGAV